MPRQAHGPRPATPALGAAAVGLAVTAFVAIAPFVSFAYRSITAHVALDTFVTVVGALLAFLSYGRLKRTGRTRDLLLTTAFSVLAVGDASFAVVPAITGDGAPSRYAVWSLVAMRLWGALFLLGAAVAPDIRRAARWLAASLLLLLVVLGALAALRGRLPMPLDPTLSPEVSGSPRITGHAALVVFQLVQLVPYAVAGYAFTRHGGREHDVLGTWLGAGAVMGACARLNYSLFPSIYSQWIYTGDVLRAASYLLFVVGAVREIQGYWQREVEVAVFAERRRMARDLHDGAVQEIGWMRQVAARRTHDDESSRLVAAADRALGEMRAALAALTVPVDEPLADTLRRAAGEVCDRYDVALALDVDPAVAVGSDIRDDLVRIVREATGNAARHGAATHVVVTLGDRGGTRRLVVHDNGVGFDPARVRTSGFGLHSMRERVQRFGGELTVESRTGEGTRIEVTW